MLTLCLTSLIVALCEAAPGGYGGSSGGGGGGGGGYGNVVSVGGNGVLQAVSNSGPIPAAIQSSHTVEIQTVDIPHNPITPQVIEVDANVLPLTIHFKSASSAINVVQTHQPGQAGETQQTSSEDEPHHLLHEVTKPIIQEVREVITPYRRVVQEIRPVQEEIQTIVARGEPRQQIQNQDFSGFNGGRTGGFAGGYGGAGNVGGFGGVAAGYGGVSNGGYANAGSGGSAGMLGGSVSILSDSGATGSTSSRATGSKKSKIEQKTESSSSSSGIKDYSKS